jgi:hypothetical protein
MSSFCAFDNLQKTKKISPNSYTPAFLNDQTAQETLLNQPKKNKHI